MQIIEIKNLSVGYNGNPVLSHFDLSVSSGEFISIIGPNGAGKTTLFKTLMGFLPSHQGTVELFGLKDKIGYVPQKISVDKNIPIAVREFLALKRQSNMSHDEIMNIKTTLGINLLEDRCLGALSTGEQQRVFLTFALMGKPKLILLDESLEGIDMGAQSRIYQFLSQLTKEDCSIILISHDISAVSQWSSRVVCVGQRKVYDGDPKSPEFHKCLHQIYGEKSFIHDHHH